ncbi:hypothetical protein KW846_15355 [Pseudomonas sp. PDM32]|uniref:hypothetical protein n=1 Tax=Pseudomonas sp. PDM32 TaxID=2854768 RepID=UPI001C456A73|nr:hypothetical protein [Pseudomonas sp. PDM32]MBV7574072.1 hypothetical protein [Pseudomonas sp. PDM32]
MSAIQAMPIQGGISLSQLDVRFEVPGIESKRVFANGRMQVRVWVFVEAVDESGAPVPLAYFPDLISTRLIRYHDAEPLARDAYNGHPLPGWNSSFIENRYTHEMPGFVQSPGGGGSAGTPMEFWVSSSVEGQLQIAAEVTIQGQVYRSNKTINPNGSRINRSVVITADRSPAYSHDQFTWKSQKLLGSFKGYNFFKYDLGLYPGGRQVRLLEWKTSQYGESGIRPVKFCYTGLILSHPVPRSFTGVMASVGVKTVDLIGQHLPVDCADGELVAFKGVPPVYKYSPEEVRLEPFKFIVLDEFGNTHQLMLVIDIESSEFLLRRG